jgi:hypothetical protein
VAVVGRMDVQDEKKKFACLSGERAMGDEPGTRRLLRMSAVPRAAPNGKVDLGDRVSALEKGKFRQGSRFSGDPRPVTGACVRVSARLCGPGPSGPSALVSPTTVAAVSSRVWCLRVYMKMSMYACVCGILVEAARAVQSRCTCKCVSAPSHVSPPPHPHPHPAPDSVPLQLRCTTLRSPALSNLWPTPLRHPGCDTQARSNPRPSASRAPPKSTTSFTTPSRVSAPARARCCPRVRGAIRLNAHTCMSVCWRRGGYTHVHMVCATVCRPRPMLASAAGRGASLTTAVLASGRNYSSLRSSVTRFRPNTAPDTAHLGPGYVVPELSPTYVCAEFVSQLRAVSCCVSPRLRQCTTCVGCLA